LAVRRAAKEFFLKSALWEDGILNVTLEGMEGQEKFSPFEKESARSNMSSPSVWILAIELILT
jgi:hypothetical protein